MLIKGAVIHVADDPNFLNCTVQLAQHMPPGGSETEIRLNTVQLELEKSASSSTPPAHAGAAKEAGPPKPHAGNKEK